jgi:hypothetical protein
MSIQEQLEALGYYTIEDRVTDVQSSLIELESVVGRLPDTYRRFAETYGVLGFEDYVYFTLPDESRVIMDVFFAVCPGDDYDIRENYEMHLGRIPDGMLPVGSDPGGNLVCISIVGDRIDSVLFWNHETEKVIHVTDSFEGFVGSLVRDE